MSKICWVGYILTAVLAVAAIVDYLWMPVPPAKFVGLTEAQVPMNIGIYHGTSIPVDAQTKAALPSADIIEREYIAPDGEAVNATIIGGVGRNQLHDPRSCLVGAGWQIENDHVEKLLGTKGGVTARACQASIGSNDNPGDWREIQNDDILYLYVVDKRIVSSASSIRWTLLLSDLLEQTDEPVYYIRTIMPIPPSPEGAAVLPDQHRHLVQFTAALWNELSPTIYLGEKS